MHDDLTLPDGSVRIPLRAKDGTVRAYAIVDAADAAWVNQWTWRLTVRKDGRSRYACRRTREAGIAQAVFLHRELLGLPRVRDGRQGDHKDRDGLNNRRANLRIATHAQNLQNKSSYRGSTSKYRGVCWLNRSRRWVAYVCVNGKMRQLGTFQREEDAASVAATARRELMPFALE